MSKNNKTEYQIRTFGKLTPEYLAILKSEHEQYIQKTCILYNKISSLVPELKHPSPYDCNFFK